MLSFEHELERLRPLLGEPEANALLARERREVFSVHVELRIIAWGGAMLLAAAAGILLKDNLERLGPLVLSLLIGAAAVACYAFVWFHRPKASLVDDYILLLGALLVSADVAFIESQFNLLGDAWYPHLLILAVLHGAAAYAYHSRTLLTLSLAAMAAWLGVHPDENRLPDATDFAIRTFEAGAVALMWRFLEARYRPASDFLPIFEHFVANAACIAAVALVDDRDTRHAGFPLALVAAGLTIAWGFRTRRELFVLYGFLYAVYATDNYLLDLINDRTAGYLLIVISMAASIAGLFAIHAHFRELRR